jgi:hypothetical protein
MELQKRVYVVGTVSDTGNEIALIKTRTSISKMAINQMSEPELQSCDAVVITGEDNPPEKL